jgi:adenylate cyclase
MRVPLRLPVRRAGRDGLAIGLIACAAILCALIARWTSPLCETFDRVDQLLYDSLYHARTAGDAAGTSDVVIVAIDENSIKAMDRARQFGWPWPREFWGILAQHAARCGARAVVFDLIFSETSVYENATGDDDRLAELLAACRIPVAFAVHVDAEQPAGRFAPPIRRPIVGAANLAAEEVLRTYVPFVNGVPSLAVRAAEISGLPHNIPREPFLLHYYGPHEMRNGRTTFTYLPAGKLISDALESTPPGSTTRGSIDPSILRDKIIVVGATFAAGFDVKASPLSVHYPGVEYQATAIENLLHGQRVIPIPAPGVAVVGLLASLFAAGGAILPTRDLAKALASALSLIILIAVAVFLFRGPVIRWLPLAMPLLATLFALAGSFLWVYLSEARQRRFILRALKQYVSPMVAQELADDPAKLVLGGQRREMTVMFTDIAGFTGLVEALPVEQVSRLLNFYLGEMSSIILDTDGTLDKYLGDAIMCFWNAPIDQPDHAMRACRAALALQRRGNEIRQQLIGMGVADGLSTRIGINSGPMLVGNMGSSRKFDYTVVGDAVNYASRLEAANRFYQTSILISESTLRLVGGDFFTRRVDLLKVKGHHAPQTVYELVSHGPGDGLIRQRIDAYETALRLYQVRQWPQASEILVEILKHSGDDGPARALLERIEQHQRDTPAADWDGSFDPGVK